MQPQVPSFRAGSLTLSYFGSGGTRYSGIDRYSIFGAEQPTSIQTANKGMANTTSVKPARLSAAITRNPSVSSR